MYPNFYLREGLYKAIEIAKTWSHSNPAHMAIPERSVGRLLRTSKPRSSESERKRLSPGIQSDPTSGRAEHYGGRLDLFY